MLAAHLQPTAFVRRLLRVTLISTARNVPMSFQLGLPTRNHVHEGPGLRVRCRVTALHLCFVDLIAVTLDRMARPVRCALRATTALEAHRPPPVRRNRRVLALAASRHRTA